jgi:26S proteasome regulatory subunit T1
LDEGDIALMKTYGQAPYGKEIKSLEADVRKIQDRLSERMGVKETDTGLAPPHLWDLNMDRQRMKEDTLQVARCTKIFKTLGDDTDKYLISIKQIAKFVVGLGLRVAPTDIEEGMRVG